MRVVELNVKNEGWCYVTGEPQAKELLEEFGHSPKPQQFFWCSHCGGVYHYGDFKFKVTKKNAQFDHTYDLIYCPHKDCYGDYLLDRHKWADKFPPDPSKSYPVYPCHYHDGEDSEIIENC